jgi:molybdopterin synthase catalytic subunit
MYLFRCSVLEIVRVITLTGNAQSCKRFLDILARTYTVATVRLEREMTLFQTDKNQNQILSIKSPTRHVFIPYSGESAQVVRELDLLAEQEDVDFASIIGSSLASSIEHYSEVHKAQLDRFDDFEEYFKVLETIPEWITLGALIRAVRSHPDIHKAGAILTFTGIVRGDALALEFDIYEGKAQQRIYDIVRDLRATEGIVDVKVHHRSGYLKTGDDIIYIVVGASHRQEGFKALRDAIERIKKEVPIWKKEITEQGEKWKGM